MTKSHCTLFSLRMMLFIHTNTQFFFLLRLDRTVTNRALLFVCDVARQWPLN